MPDVIGDLAPERKLGPVLGCEPAQRKNLPKRAAAEEDDEQDGKKEAWNRIARDDNGRGPDVEPRAVAHRLFDPKRDRDEVGEQRHPEPERDRHRQLLFDELQDGYIAEIRSPKIKRYVILKHQSEALIGGLVEAELLFEFGDELGVEPLGAPVFGRIIAPPCSAARRTHLPATAKAGRRAGFCALQLREDTRDWPARRKLHDDKVDKQDSEQGRNHKENAARDIGEHRRLSPSREMNLLGLVLVEPPGRQHAKLIARGASGMPEDIPIGDKMIGLVPHWHPIMAGA